MASTNKLTSTPAADNSESRARLRDAVLIPLLLTNVAVLAYGNSLAGDFVFDDEHDIIDNERLRDIWTCWLPTPGVWRPVTSLSLALNQAASKSPLWFHAVNVVIHLTAALILYGIVRRTLLLPLFGREPRASAECARG